jgi:hypothetical protein
MTQSLPAIFGRFKTEKLRSPQGKHDKAQNHQGLVGASSPFNRQAQLLSLLARIQVDGAQTHEQEIDRLRAVDDLSDTEREIVREIFCLGFDAAEKEQRQDKIRVYRWLLARLLLNHTLDQPIPLNERSPEIPPEVTAHVAEPSVTQQSLRRGDTARRDRTAPVSRRVFRYALCSIGVAALIWTALAFRSPTDVPDTVLPVHDNQQDIARASAAEEHMVEPVNHAGALTPSAEIAPAAERASISTVELAPMSNAIDDEVATSSKIPATAKPDTPAQPGMTKSPAKVAKRPTTVDAAMGKDREREPARDSLPIYQTRRSILLREEPRFGAPSQIMLDAGARLIVLEINGPWLKVKMENTGSPGFVREEFVGPTGAVAPSGASKDQSPH